MSKRRWTAVTAGMAGMAVVVIAACAAVGAEEPQPKPLTDPLMTSWAKDVRINPSFFETAFPNVQVWHGEGDILDGLWDYAIADAAQADPPRQYDGRILVPFPVESALSRVGKGLEPGRRLWYRRTFDATKSWQFPGRRVLLHFNGVTGPAVVRINGKEVGRHTGTYGEFAFDITDALVEQGKAAQEVVVGVLGPAGGSDPVKPAGCGIWRTVWLEAVHSDRIADVSVAGDVDAGVLRVTATCAGNAADCTVEAVALDRGSEVARGGGKAGEAIALAIRNAHLWSPSDPFLYDLRVTLNRGKQRVDGVESYFAMRKVAVGADDKGARRILLNGKPLLQCGVQDAGRWPDGLCTPPTERAVRAEIERIKQVGFNMVRKRGKVESDYWYYLCDRLGLLVWQDLPAGVTAEELQRIVATLGRHPSIVTWVIDGVARGGPADAAALVAAIRQADPSRLAWVADAAPQAKLGDIVGTTPNAAPASQAAPLDDQRAVVLAPLGGRAQTVAGHTWTPDGPGEGELPGEKFTAEFIRVFERLAGPPTAGRAVSAAIYGPWADDETSRTGLLTYDRAVVKVDPEALASAAGKSALTPHVRVVLATARTDGSGWRYATKEVPSWHTAEFDDSGWQAGSGGFGTRPPGGGGGGGAGSDAGVRTDWSGGELFLRRAFTLDLAKLRDGRLLLRAAGEVEVFLNGRFAMKVQGTPGRYAQLPLDGGAVEALRPGRNVLALRCRRPKDAAPYVDAGLVEFIPQRDDQLPAKLTHWPLVDAFMRDTCICVGPDGTYYLTGTTGNWGDEGIRLWQSKDLAAWEDLGLVWTPEKNATWQLRDRPRKGFCLWAPELHYLKGTFWYTYCVSYPPKTGGVSGTGLLRSTSGKATGPYAEVHPEGPMTPGLDATLFQDDDGKVYFLWGGNSIVRMKDDMGGFAEQPRSVGTDEGGTVGFEGIFMFRIGGKYYLSATACPLPERDYDCMVAIGDNPYGPFHRRYKAVAHGGHNMFFKDTAGQWWCTMFGGGPRAPFIHRPGILRIEFAPDGTLHPLMDGR